MWGELECIHSEGFCSVWPGYQRSLEPGWRLTWTVWIRVGLNAPWMLLCFGTSWLSTAFIKGTPLSRGQREPSLSVKLSGSLFGRPAVVTKAWHGEAWLLDQHCCALLGNQTGWTENRKPSPCHGEGQRGTLMEVHSIIKVKLASVQPLLETPRREALAL